MANLTDVPTYSANEIYQIAGIDPVEGAQAGASFGEIGVANEPHQKLANRTAFLKGRQDTNIVNIGVLQAFMAKFTSRLQQNGFIKIGVQDETRGAAIAIIQWGYHQLIDERINNDKQYAVIWPIPFPTAILVPPLATNVYLRPVALILPRRYWPVPGARRAQPSCSMSQAVRVSGTPTSAQTGSAGWRSVCNSSEHRRCPMYMKRRTRRSSRI